MSVHYKFKSEKDFSRIIFDGSYISVEDVKKEIYRQRRLGRSENIDLKITNAESREEYTSDDTLIPKNTSLTVIRVPVVNSYNKKKPLIQQQENPQPKEILKNPSHKFSINLTTMKATEEEKIFAMMMQSTYDYQNYQTYTKKSLPPSTYVCRKCKVPGHWIRDCQFNPQKSHRYDPKERKVSKKMTGIPMSMRNKEQNCQNFQNEVKNFKIPENFFCSICRDVFRCPVTMPCCRAVFCTECVVGKLLESDESDCPKCGLKHIQPAMLIDNVELKENIENSLKVEKERIVQYERLSRKI